LLRKRGLLTGKKQVGNLAIIQVNKNGLTKSGFSGKKGVPALDHFNVPPGLKLQTISQINGHFYKKPEVE